MNELTLASYRDTLPALVGVGVASLLETCRTTHQGRLPESFLHNAATNLSTLVFYEIQSLQIPEPDQSNSSLGHQSSSGIVPRSRTNQCITKQASFDRLWFVHCNVTISLAIYT